MHDIKIQYILTKTAVRDTDNTEGRGLKSIGGRMKAQCQPFLSLGNSGALTPN